MERSPGPGASGTHAPAGDARPVRRGRGERILEVAVVVLVTVLVAGLGTVAHRLESGPVPLGILLGIVLALSGGILVRALTSVRALVGYGVGGLAVVLLMTYWGPGGDVLVTSSPRAMLTILTMPLAAAVAWAAPRSWFSDREVSFRRRRVVDRPTPDDDRARPGTGA
jgi:hypothetical protein